MQTMVRMPNASSISKYGRVFSWACADANLKASQTLVYLFKFISQQGSLRRIWSLGALGEGSGWDLRIRPAATASAAAASGNLGIKIGLKWVHMARYGSIPPPK